ncbi:hypothetical protein NM688_g7007 [Phlebia brevispora]|uniref:Uncharacterized protein n=1 Tax=Phlebia brevispora TaxID=194682 RepID=A0ACC1SA86_9APHY|nr:hypothetical protein NM688_g7007 [Phlebia brevispora]
MMHVKRDYSKSPRLTEGTSNPIPPKKAKVTNTGVRQHENSPESSSSSPRRVPQTRHSHQELWKWTLTTDAIAPCRIRDIFEMQECTGGKAGYDPDFFWLGRIPCRVVQFYGLVVGVQIYETRTVYTIDDGSGAIECNLRQSTQAQFSQKSQKSGEKLKPHVRPSGPSANQAPPKPLARLGDIVCARGRILNRHQTRLVNVEQFELCRDANVEPRHWLKAAELHKSWYYLDDGGPFVIPPSKLIITTQGDATMEADASSSRAQTQSPSRSSVASSVPSSPSSVASSLTQRSQLDPNSPPRLRHPCRLHMRDLTLNTFRIYLKHYMDNTPPDLVSSEPADDADDLWQNLAIDPIQTPTRTRLTALHRENLTPRPGRYQGSSGQATPRFLSQTNKDAFIPQEVDENFIQGYTLSHLRRVPELALLARRVIDAEAKRRAREERRKQKEAEVNKEKKKVASTSSTQAIHLSEKSGESRSAKVKRLFAFAIRQLYQEGSIVLWDGAVRGLPLPPIPALSFAPASRPPTSTIWKMGSSLSTTGDSTVLSSALQVEDEDDGNISDPPPDEEAYVPLTPSYFAGVVERAIREIHIARRREQMARLKSNSTSGPSALDIARSLRKPVEGPTSVEITAYLKKSDERWRRVGEWAVKEALQWASQRGQVVDTGNGRWTVYT